MACYDDGCVCLRTYPWRKDLMITMKCLDCL
nr:MAG TPA: hypothetical protein [Caudoviricetes sp.]DAO37715.1 MAG TPA: hypothetical protein [Caudoviricetes sp.]